MAEPENTYTDDQLNSDAVGKKDLIEFLKANGSLAFQAKHGVKGVMKNVVKKKTKDQLIADYKALFETKDFKKEGEEEEEAAKQLAKKAAAGDAAQAAEIKKLTKETEKLAVKEEKEEEVLYKKHVLKKGNKVSYPKKGETVTCLYTGKLADGTVFDTNVLNVKRGKKPIPLKFKVGTGQVIRGWDHAIQTMSVGEKCELTIQPEWAYGKRGTPDGKIPPKATLHFEVELLTVEP